MPRSAITVADLFKPVDIDIFGDKFLLRVPTRSLEEKITANALAIRDASKQIGDEKLPEDEARKIMLPLYYEKVELLLEPAEDGKGKKVHAKTVIKRLYEGDKIGLAQINRLLAQITEVREDEQRPT